MFNPSSQSTIDPFGDLNAANLVLGGMHYIYVTRQPYDECAFIKEKLEESLSFRKVDAVKLITWAAIGLGSEVPLLSYADGLIPTETVMSLRVDNAYGVDIGTNDNLGFPSYEFGIDKETLSSTKSSQIENSLLDNISVYPNPVFPNGGQGNSSNVVKLSNIPLQSLVTIYTMNGLFVKQFKVEGNNQAEGETDIEWNMKTASGAPLTSGTYFIHVQSKGVGEKVLKLIYVE